jgi:hypothetical protein
MSAHSAAILAALCLSQQGEDESGTPHQEPTEPPTVEELQRRLEELRREQEDEIEELRFDVETLEAELAQATRGQAPTAQRENVFNPAITVFANFLARLDDMDVFAEDDPTEPEIDDRFHLREVELDFRAAIDPWADGVVIATLESEVPGEFEATVEEGYVVLKRLPVLDSAPAGLKLKAGRFRPAFGRLNVVHLHDLPQTSYPRALGTFLGGEGFIQDGVGAQLFLPSWSESQTLEATLQAVNGGDAPVAGNLDGEDITGVGRLGWFADLGEGHTLDAGASALVGDSDHRLYGADLTYQWKPYASGEWRSFLLGGEVFLGDVDQAGLASSPMGFYAWTQYQLDRNLYLGLRYDWTEELEDAGSETWTLGTYITYYTTEFLRFRVGLEHTESDLDHLDGLDSALLELNTVFGSHPVEPYWVNR